MGSYYDKLSALRNGYQNGGRSNDDESNSNEAANVVVTGDIINFAIADDRSKAIAKQSVNIKQSIDQSID